MKNRAAEIHAGLKHSAIDGDGYWLEPVPVFLEYLRARTHLNGTRTSEEAKQLVAIKVQQESEKFI